MRACVFKPRFVPAYVGNTRERSEKEHDRGKQGCKSTKMRTKGRTERDGGAVWVRWL